MHNRHTIYKTTFMLLYGVGKKRPGSQKVLGEVLDYSPLIICIYHISDLRALMNPKEFHPLLHSISLHNIRIEKIFTTHAT